MPKQVRLASAKKAGDDCCRDFGRNFGKAVHERHPVLWRVGGCLIGAPGEPGPFAGAASAPASIEAGAPRRPLLDRTAGFLARGSSPRAAFPGYGSPNPSGISAQGYPLTVAGAAVDRSAWLGESRRRTTFPFTLEARDRYACDTRPNGGRVNRRRIERRLRTSGSKASTFDRRKCRNKHLRDHKI